MLAIAQKGAHFASYKLAPQQKGRGVLMGMISSKVRWRKTVHPDIDSLILSK
jgi:hypothetical protein